MTPARPHPWSLTVARPFGIEVRVHATFAVLLVWVFVQHVAQGRAWTAAISGVATVLAVFATIVLHELGHAWVARRFGIRTRDITLWPIGGIARLDRMPEQPHQELLVALAGPAVNVALAGILGAAIWATGKDASIAALETPGGALLPQLMWINVGLAAFNLVPAFPMDGGRALRALLGFWLPRERATDVAAAAGKTIAVVFGLIGLLAAPTLLLIAVFVWFGAGAEAGEIHLRKHLEGVAVAELMTTRFEVLDAALPIAFAVDRIRDGFQTEFPVIREGRVVGLLGRAEAVRALAERGPGIPVAEAMRARVEVTSPREPVVDVLSRLADPEAHGVAVVIHEGSAVGLLTARTIAEQVDVVAPRRAGAARPAAVG